jgi:hypothetical protein
VDPLGKSGDPHAYLYAQSRPTAWVDIDGLRSRVCCTPIEKAPILKEFSHCYIEVEDSPGGQRRTYGLHGMGNPRRSWGGPLGCTFEDDWFDRTAPERPDWECGPWNESCEADECAKTQFRLYPRASNYSSLGRNSNTFAGNVARTCRLSPPNIAGTWRTPGWGSSPATAAKDRTCPTER